MNVIFHIITQVLFYALGCSSSDVPRRTEAPQSAAAPRIVFLQPGYYYPSPSAYLPAAPRLPAVIGSPIAFIPPATARGPSAPVPPTAIGHPVAHVPPATLNSDIPTQDLASVTYTPIPQRGRLIADVRDVFLDALANTVSPTQVSYVRYRKPPHHHYEQLYDLREQLERNKRYPVLKLERNPINPNSEARLYAYLVEATPAMAAAFGTFRSDQLRWAILEVFSGRNAHINVVTYFETPSLRFNQVQRPFWLGLGSRTHTLEDVLRRAP
ncbi:uncharacterized protein UTRI_06219_B [Ustilago trichophora]|uniref:Effector family protein Eff1 n=1 Tax=Ustilago trichophora TaxID=86804 RepID=A0A5C3EHA1_9BASI|nr:uncharacterized protein UTRI_06219_B [Ustilago trichophora]